MRFRSFIAVCVLGILALTIAMSATAQDQPEQQPKKQKFGALAYLPAGAGPAMVGAGARANVDIYVNSYTDDAEAKSLAGALLEGGDDALLKLLEKKKSIGKITLTG